VTTSEPAAADGQPTLNTVLSAARSRSVGVARLIWRALTSLEGADRHVDTAQPIVDIAQPAVETPPASG